MLNERSKKALEGVDKRLQRIVEKASNIVPFPILVTEGLRSKERQAALYAQGRTAPGKVVTWTLKSKHIDGLAVDVVPYINKTIPWDDFLLFCVLGEAMMEAAKAEGVSLRWGYDWDGDGVLREKGETDGPHFEIKE
jgi:peptidoglycan LD-endopeptidase CwlK